MNANRRADRARRAKDTVNIAIPDILRASPRARHGIHKAELLQDPDAATPNASFSSLPAPGPKIRVQCADTLTAAARMSERPFASKRTAPTHRTKQQRPNVTILNMASPVRPGGGFLDGANSQEEFLCARTTLYPSLWDQFYRLPEIGGVHTPDVMVFRDSTPDANELQKRDRYFVDVITSGMLRFPEMRGRSDDRVEGGCSCGVSYCDKDRELVTRKMKAVMRIAESKGTDKLVLGAWGCGAYGNPVKEVAKIWRKVIAGGPRQRRPNVERWEGIKEIVFAIPDRQMLREFELAFADVLAIDTPSPGPERTSPSGDQRTTTTKDQCNQTHDDTGDLISKIAEIEMQMEQLSNPRSRARLREVLSDLNRDLQRGLAAKNFKDEDLTMEADEGEAEEEELNDYVITGVPTSDGEVYFDENDIASDSSDAALSEHFEFKADRVTRPSSYFDVDDDDERSGTNIGSSVQPSPRFDAKTGWFSGSIDEMHLFMRSGGLQREASPSSPLLRPDSSGIDEFVLNEYLGQYVEGADRE